MSRDKMHESGVPDAEPALPEDVEQAMFESLAPAPVEPGRLSAIKTRLMQRVHAEAGQPTLKTIQADEGEWQPFLPKVRIKRLQQSGDTLTYLLRLEPGAIMVPHEHPQDEECIVLEGEVRFGQTVARAGAYHLAPRGVAHETMFSETGALLFLRGAVPAASQVRWSSLGAVAALSPEPLRGFILRHWSH